MDHQNLQNDQRDQALQLLEVLRDAATTLEQKLEVLQKLKSDPSLMAICMKLKPAEVSSVDVPNQFYQQPNPAFKQGEAAIDSSGGLALGDSPITSSIEETLKTLLTMSKTPITPQKQHRILKILSNNPQLKVIYLELMRLSSAQRDKAVGRLQLDTADVQHMMSELELDDNQSNDNKT